MRYFKCFDCSHFWKIMFWEGGRGAKMACPDCKRLNVHQIQKIHGWDREGKYSMIMTDDDQISTGPEDENSIKRVV